jgi:uncharacterized membrane protein
MQSLRSLRSLFIKGLFLVLPLFMILYLLVGFYKVAYDLLAPVADLVPAGSIGGIGYPGLVVLALLITLILISGIIVSATGFGSKISQIVEFIFPSYMFVRNILNEKIEDSNYELKPCMAYMDEGWSFAFIVEELDEEMFVIYVPGSPSVASGVVSVKHKEHIRFIDSSFQKVVRSLLHFGRGGGDVLRNNVNWEVK